MHKLLKRQLRRAGLESPGDYQDERWEKLLAYIDTAYTQADEDERSIEISSREMSQLYEQLKQNSESALSLERDRLKLVLKCIGNGLFWLSETGEVVDMNLAAESLLGWSREDLVGSDISQIVLNDELSNNLNTEQQIDNGSFVCKDGHLLRVSFLRSPILSENRLQGAVLIFRDISKQLADEKALIDARDMAEQASDAKSEFLSRMSHELRTPMNAILGFAQLLQCDPEQTLSEDNNDSVNEILKGGYHLLDLINEVLDLARIESGKVTVSIESVSLKLIVDDCLALIKPLMKENGISLSTIETNNSELGVMADYTRLKQVILNLLSNAVKYNSSHGIISVFIGQVDGKVRIGIQDTGAGLSEEEQIIIFKPFPYYNPNL